MSKIHKHHTIGFESAALIDWHLRNLWHNHSLPIVEMRAAEHSRHHYTKKKREQQRALKRRRVAWAREAGWL